MDKVKKYLPIAAMISAILAVILFLVCDVFVPVENSMVEAGKGFETTFGKKEEFMGMKATIYKFNFMGLLTIILAIVAMVALAISVKKANKIAAIVSIACFVVAAIFFFCTKSFVLSANDAKDMADAYKNGIGAILAGVLSLVSAAATAVPAFLKD